MKYKREALLQAKEFRHIQKDFLSALLPKEEYTLSEARKIVSEFERSK